MEKELRKNIEKYISYILRHGATTENVKIDKEGWVLVSDIIEKIQKTRCKNFDFETLRLFVNTNSKKRYELTNDHLKIRASQGHSDISVSISFKEVIPPDVLYHGTAERFLESILLTGLNKMARQYVHLSLNKKIASEVGRRYGVLRILKINAKRMHEDGVKFFLSENNVYLVGNVETKYIEVTDE